MGCQCCKKKSQIDEPLIDKKEEEKEEIDIYKFNFEKALKLIKLLLRVFFLNWFILSFKSR